jgi:hypothetical protein
MVSPSFYELRPGLGHVGSYQVSGWPYLSGTTLLTSSYSTNNSEVKFSFHLVIFKIKLIIV